MYDLDSKKHCSSQTTRRRPITELPCILYGMFGLRNQGVERCELVVSGESGEGKEVRRGV